VSLEKGLVDSHLLDAHGPVRRSKLDDSVHEKKRIPMGQDALDALGVDAGKLI
jgi:hypothetical protein